MLTLRLDGGVIVPSAEVGRNQSPGFDSHSAPL